MDAGPLFGLARHSLQALIQELTLHNVYVDPQLALRQGEGLLCHYSLTDRTICLSIPDPETARGKFDLLLFRALLAFESNDQILDLLVLLIPWLIAHETGHHLRHHYGLFCSDRWQEEELANRLAITFIRRQLTASQQQALQQLLASAITGLSRVFHVSGDRASILSTRDPIRYVGAHLCWLYRDLLAQDSQTLAQFAQTFLSECHQ